MLKKAKIIDTYKVPKQVCDYIYNKLLKGLTNEQKQFFSHVLYCTQLYIKTVRNGYVPVSYDLMQKRWNGKLDRRPLVNMGLVKTKDYSVNGKKSREFIVPAHIIEDINKHYPKKNDNIVYYNLMKGKRVKKIERTKLTDQSRNQYQGILYEGLKYFRNNTCIFNLNELKFYIENLEVEKNQGKISKDRYFNDFFCYQSILAANPVENHNGFYEYYPVYTPQMSGRVSEQHGRLQSCTREMKKRAFTAIPNLYNYDLASSQVNILKQYFEDASIDTTWIETYLNSSKEDYANEIGVDKDTWKSIFMALIMGAKLFDPYKMNISNIINLKKCAILDYLKKYFDNDVKKIVDSYMKFYQLVKPLKMNLDEFGNYLIDNYVPNYSTYPAGKQFIYNNTGITLNVDEYKTQLGEFKRGFKKKLMAFILQGHEAAFIHHLTFISQNYDFKVISNQHDGVVTIGKIPDKAIEYAKVQSGLKYAELEIKPFV